MRFARWLIRHYRKWLGIRKNQKRYAQRWEL